MRLLVSLLHLPQASPLEEAHSQLHGARPCTCDLQHPTHLPCPAFRNPCFLPHHLSVPCDLSHLSKRNVTCIRTQGSSLCACMVDLFLLRLHNVFYNHSSSLLVSISSSVQPNARQLFLAQLLKARQLFRGCIPKDKAAMRILQHEQTQQSCMLNSRTRLSGTS